VIADELANLPSSATVDPRQLRAVLGVVHAQMVAALWLSLGMIFAFAMVSCLAFGWRRPALACGFFYSLTLCFLANGHAQILGPIGGAIAVMGFIWPQRKFQQN
jgi:hypothetical protein